MWSAYENTKGNFILYASFLITVREKKCWSDHSSLFFLLPLVLKRRATFQQSLCHVISTLLGERPKYLSVNYNLPKMLGPPVRVRALGAAI